MSTTDERTGVQYPDKIRLAGEPMDEKEAHSVVRAIKFHGVRMCQELVRAHDGQAWIALGHDSWGTFCEQVLKITRQRANQLVKSARNQTGLALMFEVAVESIDVPERWIRGVTIEQLQPMVETAVSTLPPDATYDQRASAIVGAIEQYHREHSETTTTTRASVSTTTTTKPSSGQDPAPGADESGGEDPSQDLPAASLPEGPAEVSGEGDRDGSAEDPVTDGDLSAQDADAATGADDEGAPPAVVGSEFSHGGEKGPDAAPEPVASGLLKAQVSAAIARALTLLTIDAAEAAEMLVGDERVDRAQDCERLADWLLAHHDAVMDRTLRSVG